MNSFKAFGGGECLKANGLKWFAAQQTVVLEPKAKKKYKTKKKKGKDVVMADNWSSDHGWWGASWWRDLKFKGLGGGSNTTYSTKSKKKKIGKDEASPNKAKAHERTPSPIKQRKGVDEVSIGSLVKIPATPQKQKGKENKIPKPIVELDEHVDFHSSKSSENMNSFITPWGAPRQKGANKP